LLKPAGRGLVLTEAGVAAMQQAEQIFSLGEHLPAFVRDAVSAPSMRLSVGLSNGLPKLVVRSLMQPVMDEPHLRLLCREGEISELLADLALHRLDLLLTDRTAPPNVNVKVYSHSLGASPLAWYASPELAAMARRGFPQSLAKVPVILPTPRVAVRAPLDQWFEKQGVRARVAGEFDDSALLKTFGASGMGVFPAAEMVHDELVTRYAVERVGPCQGVNEQFFAIGTEKKVQHPLVQRILNVRMALSCPLPAGAATRD
jgi:LysR family transcriptional activator of nhaA